MINFTIFIDNFDKFAIIIIETLESWCFMKYSVNDYNARISNEKEIDYSLPLRLIGSIATELFNEEKNRESKTVPMSKSIKKILFVLAQKDGITQLDIVKSTGLKAPTVSISLQKMEKDGYVVRTPDNYDLRSVRVILSEKGRDIYNSAVSYIQKSESKIMKNISVREAEMLTDILQKIYNNLGTEH